MSDPLDLFIRPADVLIFRDGRPFSAGDDHRATGYFPPAPTAFYGALRAAAFAGNGLALHPEDLLWGVSDLLRREMGTPDAFGEMTIAHFSLGKATNSNGVEPLFPMPADVLRRKGDLGQGFASDWIRGTPDNLAESTIRPVANWPVTTLRFLWQRNHESAWYEAASHFLTADGFQAYLRGDADLSRYLAADGEKSPYRSEPRTSLEITDGTQTAEDGRLFEVDFTRLMPDIGFALRLTRATTLEGASSLRLGGESRPAYIERRSIATLPAGVEDTVRKRILEEKRCTLMLVTPAIFESGWRPHFVGPDGSGNLSGCTFTLVGAALGRPITLGGWDIVGRRPRPARRAVPAGSVYFLEQLGGEVEAFFRHVREGSICAVSEDRKCGLGLAALGAWPTLSTREK
jgi:CRISPR-associated protein Cmr3